LSERISPLIILYTEFLELVTHSINIENDFSHLEYCFGLSMILYFGCQK